MGSFFEVNVRNLAHNTVSTIKMEEGVTFENKSCRYTMQENGELLIFDKRTNETTIGDSITVTDYQSRTLAAVMDNTDDLNGKSVLSRNDIQKSIEQSRNNELSADLSQNVKNGYVVKNAKAFEDENKFSAYVTNGKRKQSGVISFKYEKKYHDVVIKNVTTNEQISIKMEAEVSFENNGAIYRMQRDGRLATYNKTTKNWEVVGNEIKMTGYQIQTFQSVANNVSEEQNNIVLSKSDIDSALEMFRDGGLKDDLSENINSNSDYENKNVIAYSKKNAFSTYVTNGISNQSANLVFKYGTKKDAIRISNLASERISDANNRENEQQSVAELEVSKDCIDLVKQYESLSLKAYLCPAKIPTIGYGHTAGVRIGQKITREQADEFLRQDMQTAIDAVRNNVKVELTQGQFDALVSFVFNLGETNFKASTLLKYINNGDFEAAEAQFGRWVYAGEKKLRGLVRRREAEAKMFRS